MLQNWMVFQERFDPKGAQHLVRYVVWADSADRALEQAVDNAGCLLTGWSLGMQWTAPCAAITGCETKPSSQYVICNVGACA